VGAERRIFGVRTPNKTPRFANAFQKKKATNPCLLASGLFCTNLELELRPRDKTGSPREVSFLGNGLHLEVVGLDHLNKYQLDNEGRVKSAGAGKC
jgi:hypothetical protein